MRKVQWANRSDEYKLKCSEDKQKRWDEQSDEYKQKCSEDGKKRMHDLQKISSGSTEEETYYAIDGANEDGTYILTLKYLGPTT